MRDWHLDILSAYKQGDDERLRTLLEEARAVAKKDVGYYTALGEILSDQEELQGAMEAYALALHHGAGITPELLDKIQSVLARYRTSSPDPQIRQTRMTPFPLPAHRLTELPAWQQKAYAYATSGHAEEASTLIREYVQLHPDDVNGRLTLRQDSVDHLF